jgi:hypothetical protein
LVTKNKSSVITLNNQTKRMNNIWCKMNMILPCASRTYYTYPWIINLHFGYVLQTLLSRTKKGDKVSLYSNFMGQSPSLSLHLKYKMMEVVETIWRSHNNLIGTIYIYIWWKLQTKIEIQQVVCKFLWSKDISINVITRIILANQHHTSHHIWWKHSYIQFIYIMNA